jgi:regulator of sigma E protease
MIERIIIPLNSVGGPINDRAGDSQAVPGGALPGPLSRAFISVNLGFLNILPIPVLNGGHILFCLIEIVTRRPPS